MQIVALCARKGDSFIIEGRTQFVREIVSSFGEGEEFLLSADGLKEAVSQKARGYYFGVVLKKLHLYSGHSIDDLHAWAKAKFTPKHLTILDGNGRIVDDLVIGSTTTTFDPLQFFDFVEELRAYMVKELQVETPDPDPRWREKATAA